MRPKFWLGLLLTVVVFSILINLGLWQLSRGHEKVLLEQSLSEREFSANIELAELDVNQYRYLTGLRATAELEPIPGKYLLLDNQTYQGKVGYLALQLMRIDSEQSVLFEVGFVEAEKQRNQLPNVIWLDKPERYEVRVYRRSANPLSNELHLEAGKVGRIQNLNITELEAVWQQSIAPYVVQPQLEDWRYPQPWQPIPLSSEKHYGYALQWFSMALALLLLSCWVLWRALRKGDSNE
ncbi:SURF1 family protein [Vibrio atypicus]|uniref:SURF1 family protein n=1 Tax=Vibrio atypicus TaxID=558271 RepID=UPI003735B9F0